MQNYVATDELYSSVGCIFKDKTGNLWFGTAGGGTSMLSNDALAKLAKIFDKVKQKAHIGGKIFKTFTTADGLADNVITAVMEDKDGRLYFGTNWGFSRLSGWKKENKDSVPVFETFNRRTGCPVQDVNGGSPTMFQDSKGIIWIATGDDKTALVRFDPSGVMYNTEPPVVVIQSVRVNEENICWYSLRGGFGDGRREPGIGSGFSDSATIAQQEITTYGKLLTLALRESMEEKFGEIEFDGITRFYPLPENLVLPYNHNHITFEYNAIELARHYLVHYQYMLDGLDDTWGPITQKTDVSYNNLWEGSYTFKLKAQYTGLSTATGGAWSEPVIYTFRVLPPWYRTWWMYGLYILCLAGFVISVMKIRERNLLREKDILEKQVEHRTEQLRKANKELEKLSMIASKTNNAILITNNKFEIEWVNKAFESMSGYTLEEYKKARGKTLMEVSGSMLIKEQIQKCINTGQGVIYESQNENVKGEKYWVQTTLTAIMDEAGKVKELIAVDSNINKLKETQEELKRKNQDIIDSIRYASTIQQAILTPVQEIKNFFPASFVLFKPRDIVSGDFYFHVGLSITKRWGKGSCLIAAIDCTGHGVPGAFMSMIGNEIINQIVLDKGITTPSEILNQLHEGIKYALHQQEEKAKAMDGMDIALCMIDYNSNILQFAGAKRPLYMVSPRDGLLKEIKADKPGIGGEVEVKRSFTNHSLTIEKGAMIYMFSDGYSDQFGGVHNKKYTSKRFREKISGINHLKAEDQEKELLKELERWKGNYDQIDDILVIEIRL